MTFFGSLNRISVHLFGGNMCTVVWKDLHLQGQSKSSRRRKRRLPVLVLLRVTWQLSPSVFVALVS